jgi:hypothetical protein
MKLLFCNHISKALVLTFALALTSNAETVVNVSTFATGAAVTATGPDSITVGGGFVWVSYTNGARSTGGDGKSSTIVQYELNGTVHKTFSIAGSVDGLKIEPETGLVWALQNQDGNSTLTLINPKTETASAPLQYKVTSATRGYDDVVFREGQIFLSYTNPGSPTDPTIQRLVNRTSPLIVTPVLTMGATGFNLATDKPNQPTAQSDPDSLKLTPGGGLMLTSGDDGQLIFVLDPEVQHPRVAFLSLLDSKQAPVSGLDDAIFATSEAGTFYLTDTGNNRVLKIDVEGIAFGTLYACVGSINQFAKVNLETGVVTSVVNTLKAPHGLAFVPKSDDENEREDRH